MTETYKNYASWTLWGSDIKYIITKKNISEKVSPFCYNLLLNIAVSNTFPFIIPLPMFTLLKWSTAFNDLMRSHSDATDTQSITLLNMCKQTQKGRLKLTPRICTHAFGMASTFIIHVKLLANSLLAFFVKGGWAFYRPQKKCLHMYARR